MELVRSPGRRKAVLAAHSEKLARPLPGIPQILIINPLVPVSNWQAVFAAEARGSDARAIPNGHASEDPQPDQARAR